MLRTIVLLLSILVGLIFPMQLSPAYAEVAEQPPQKRFSFVDAYSQSSEDETQSNDISEEPAKKELTINTGTRVPIVVYNTVSSNNLNEGDMVSISVSQDVKVEGHTIFKKGSEGVLYVSKAKKGRGHGGKGVLEVNGGRIYDVYGNDYQLNLSINREGVSKRGWAVVATIFGILLILVPFGIWIDGKPAMLQGGAQFDAMITAPKTIVIPN